MDVGIRGDMRRAIGVPARRHPSAIPPRRASVAASGLAFALAWLVAGCAVGTPLEQPDDDAIVTGSISAPADPASPAAASPASASSDKTPSGKTSPVQPSAAPDRPLDAFVAPADQGAVMTALGAALDPQSAGAPVAWAAGGGQQRGEARPTGLARPVDDEICRPFALDGLGVKGRFAAAGVACRDKRGDWRLREIAARSG